MAVGHKTTQNFEELLASLADLVARDSPHLSSLFTTFAQEARFGRAWLDENLNRLAPGGKILEVGAGLMLLSCQLCSEGYDVTALEPIGEGFSSFAELQNLVLGYATERGIAPKIMGIPVEQLSLRQQFDFVYSVNVMEHVDNVPQALHRITEGLKPGGQYRFTCPNYLFPYEPHFNMPTLFSKTLTERAFHGRIFAYQGMHDPAGVWRSLNWISVPQIKRIVHALPGISLTFRRTVLRDALERVVHDSQFSGRRAKWVRQVAAWLVANGIHRSAAWIPVTMQPIIDCTLEKH